MSPPPIPAYLKAIADRHRRGDATEHSYRGDLEILLRALLPAVDITNEPRRITDCGAPDYVLKRNAIPLGYIEAKDVDKSLDDKTFRAQFHRYVASLDNFIFTNYLEFRFYRNSETKPVAVIAIAELRGDKIKPLPQHFDEFTSHIENFGAYQGQPITAADDLAKRMADKARLLAGVIEKSLNEENDTDESRTLDAQLRAFRKQLLADVDVEKFAGIYAQAIAYGMFVARLHDARPADFTRHKAPKLIPRSNPFLKKFFGYIADYDLDERIRWLVDDLADIFRATDVEALMKDFGKATQRTDPFIHFYETFLGKYDGRLRKSRGVYYTPEPVVSFIVRAVDAILKTEFKLPGGLADTAKTTATANGAQREVHKVQILDPATGTGTFLAEVVKFIYANFGHLKGAWRGYVEKDLIPRLNGFEILMAPYAMAHLKLEMILRDTGCETDDARLRVYLTSALEEHHPDTDTLFAVWLSDESKAADEIKRDTPVMVVLGNPPYSGESMNKGAWITALMDAYKQEPGGGKLQEKNAKWLNDDYAKFIRCGQHFIDRSGYGVLAYINNHSFLDNPTFRGMRWSLLQSFDAIYIIDLHGNSKKQEVSPDGSKDKNVFDIQQGVSINLFVKTGAKKAGEIARVFHYDLYGERESKYEFLWGNEFAQINFAELKPQAPQYFFVPKDYSVQEEYDQGISVVDLFPVNGAGITTAHDDFVIDTDKNRLLQTYKRFQASSRDAELLHTQFNVKKKAGWNILDGYDNIKNESNLDKYIKPVIYRPFDSRFIFYEGKLVWRTVEKVMRHFLAGENVGLIFPRRSMEKGTPVFLAKNPIDKRGGHSWAETISYLAPLYLYPDENQKTIGGEVAHKPNLNADIIQQIAAKLGMKFTPEKTEDTGTFAPLDILDYIYAALHSPAYRKKFREFLKIDFPRVPYPRDKKQFRALAKLGAELRALHLMESAKLNVPAIPYQQPGDNIVTTVRFDAGKVYINKTQHFAEVPQTAWEFYIGGYQPAQKYLKDRRDRALTWDEIAHYQKIIVALVETARVMKQIDAVV